MSPCEQTVIDTSPIIIVAVHLGASNTLCNETHRNIAKLVCETVMKEARSETESGDVSQRQTNRSDRKQLVSTAEDAVVRAIELMESEKSLNCGYGSNLNIQGKVECDASLMSSKGQVWTGVGSVAGCKSPIRLAKSLLDQYTRPRPLGLTRPNFLVASGARRWMRDHCPDLIVPDSCMISSRALARYQDVKSNYDLAMKKLETTCPDGSVINCDQTSERYPIDTVGAVAVDCAGNFACAVSSGGIILKHQGRVGQAAVPGAGCWAQDSMAITTTGVGEYLTATLFAKTFFEKLKTVKMLDQHGHPQVKRPKATSTSEAHSRLVGEATSQCFRDFLGSPALSHVPQSERLAGMLTISSFRSDLPTCGQDIVEKDGESDDLNLYLTYGHNTKSLCVGYMVSSATEAESIVSQTDDNDDHKEEHSSGSSQRTDIAYRTIKLVCRRMSMSV